MSMLWYYLVLMGSVWSTSLPAPSDLRVEYLTSPIGLSEIQPRFSFVVNCTKCPRGTSQHAVEIIVAKAYGKHGIVWNSGILVSNRTSQLEYDGLPLEAEMSYVWTVRWWAIGQSTPSPNSTAHFDIGLLSETDWAGAEWIGGSKQTQLRHEFIVPTASPIIRARAYIVAPGCHSLYVNGKEYGSSVLGSDQLGVCPWTQFGKSVLYQTHDLYSLVRSGPNVIGLLLGNGMWSGQTHNYAKDPGVRVKLTVDLMDGSRVVVISEAPPSLPKLCATIKEHEKVTLQCPSGHTINKIDFASFGMSTGNCVGDSSKSDTNTFAINSSCNANNVTTMLHAACVGQKRCTLTPRCNAQKCTIVPGGSETQDPCFQVSKHLSVAVQCISGRVSSDVESWYATNGPFLQNDPFFGTRTDWRLLDYWPNNPWSTPSFNINQSVVKWTPALAMPLAPPGQLRSLTMPFTRVIRIVHPILPCTQLGKDVYRYDFPENFVGVVRVTIRSRPPAGSTVTLKHGEILMENGTVSFPWDEKKQTDVHILDNKTDVLTLTPRFTWHGFQYVQVSLTGFTWNPKLVQIEGLVLHTNLEQTGKISFTGGLAAEGKLLTQIQGLVTASQLSNVAAYQPTDCPSREKHGWLGDAQVTAEEAMYNFQMAPIYTEFLNTIRDGQHSESSATPNDVPPVCPINGLGVKPHFGDSLIKELNVKPPSSETRLSYSSDAAKYADISWTAAYPLLTRWMLKYYGDTRVVTRHFNSLMRYMDALLAHSKSSPDGLPDFWTWGDWCAVEPRTLERPGTGPELAAFNYILGLDAMAEMASAINQTAAHVKYANLAEKFRPIFHSLYFNGSTGTYGRAPLEVQSLTVAPLALGNTIPKDKMDSVLKGLQTDIETRDNHFTIGSVGAKHFFPQLTAHGLYETAMRVATQTSYPSYGHWIKMGATTCWENYSGKADESHPPPPTHNHIFLCGGFGEWVYRSVAGIAPIADGYDHIIIAPQISRTVGPSGTQASLWTVRGAINVEWALHGDKLTLDVLIPLNIHANVEVPLLGASQDAFKVLESDAPVWANGTFIPGVDGVFAGTQHGQRIILSVLSGTYRFQATK